MAEDPRRAAAVGALRADPSLTARQLADRVNASVQSIRRWLTDANLQPAPSVRISSPTRPVDPRKTTVLLLHEERLSYEEISRRTGVSKQTIADWTRPVRRHRKRG